MKRIGQSLLARVLLVTFAAVLLSVFIPTAVISRINVRSQISGDETSIASSFASVESGITKLLDQAASAGTSLTQKQEVSDYILGHYKSDLTKVQARRQFDSALETVFRLYPHMTDILFFTDGNIIAGSSLDWHYSGVPYTNEEFLQRAYTTGLSVRSAYWFDTISAAALLPSNVDLEIVQERTGYRVCGVTRLLYTYAGSALSTSVVELIAVDEADIRQRYSYLADPGTNIYIINEEGKCLSSTDTAAITQTAAWYGSVPEETSGSFRFTDSEGQSLQLFYRRFKATGWTIVKTVPTAVYSGSTGKLYRTAAYVALLALAVITPVLMLSIRHILRPLNKLTDAMTAVKCGDLETRIECDERDPAEVRIVAGQANEMLDSLTALMERIKTDEMNKHKLEMQTLQSQITPHFMFNTLSSIRWMAQMSGSEDVAHMLLLFSQLLHPIYSDWAEKWTLSEEFAFTRSYIDLVHIRYAGKVRITVDDAHLPGDPLVPRFTLQPALENSCEHAVRPDRDLNVRISFEQRRDALIIHVTDDGVGMSAEALAGLNAVLDSDTEPQRAQNGHRSIGLYNIHKRLKLLYGDRYGIRVSSMRDVGTTVDIMIGI